MVTFEEKKKGFNSLVFVGIDPGKTGAAAVIEVDEAGKITLLGIIDIEFNKTKGLAELRDFFQSIEELANRNLKFVRFFIEEVHSMPRDGVASSFNFGKLFGSLLGYMEALGVKYKTMTPVAWRNVIKEEVPDFGSVKDRNKKKEESLGAAKQILEKYGGEDMLFLFKRKKDHNRADAFLIAVAGAKKYGAF